MKKLTRPELNALQTYLCEQLDLDPGTTFSVTIDPQGVTAEVGTRDRLDRSTVFSPAPLEGHAIVEALRDYVKRNGPLHLDIAP